MRLIDCVMLVALMGTTLGIQRRATPKQAFGWSVFTVAVSWAIWFGLGWLVWTLTQ